jgi:4-alpha-glucanotransferase
LRPEHPSGPTEPFTPQLAHALHLYLARSRTALVAVQIEDLLGMIDPVNVPGTHQEYPNWQRKVTADLEDLAAREDLAGQFRELGVARAMA